MQARPWRQRIKTCAPEIAHQLFALSYRAGSQPPSTLLPRLISSSLHRCKSTIWIEAASELITVQGAHQWTTFGRAGWPFCSARPGCGWACGLHWPRLCERPGPRAQPLRRWRSSAAHGDGETKTTSMSSRERYLHVYALCAVCSDIGQWHNLEHRSKICKTVSDRSGRCPV